jgi:hypothetical protein
VSSSTGRRWQWRWAARASARRGARGLYTWLGASVDDEGVTAKMPRRATAFGRRAYGVDAADGPAVRGVRTRTAARTRGASGGGASGRGTSGRASLGRRAAGDGGVLSARRRGVRRSARFCFAGAVFEIAKL